MTLACSRGGSGVSEAAPQGTEGETESCELQLSPEHQRGGRDVWALPPAAVGRRLPGRALCADRGSEHHRDPERDFSAPQHYSPDAFDDPPASHHSSTRWAPAQLAFCAFLAACLAELPSLPSVRGGRGGPRSGNMAAGRSPAGPGTGWPEWGSAPVGRGGGAPVALRLFLTPKCPCPRCFI